jgi:hypothetical protein
MARPNKTLAAPAFIAALFLVIVAFFRLPYGYYTFLRIVVCIASIYTALRLFDWDYKWQTWVFVAVAVLFNPLIPVHLGRDIWIVIDFIVAVLMIVTPFYFKIL